MHEKHCVSPTNFVHVWKSDDISLAKYFKNEINVPSNFMKFLKYSKFISSCITFLTSTSRRMHAFDKFEEYIKH